MIPYEYVEIREGGQLGGLLSDWPLDDRERRALIIMLLRLFRTDSTQAVGSFLFKEPEPGIYYAKATGKTQLRPRLCRGPQRPNDEVTFLVRAVERDGKTIPQDAARRAASLALRVAVDDSTRRRYRPMPPLT